MKKTYDYPKCPKKVFEEEYFGITLKDDYHWLVDANHEEALDWVAKENAFTDAYFDQNELQNMIKTLKEKAPKAKYGSIEKCKDGYYVSKNEQGATTIYHCDENFANEVVVLKKNQVEHFSAYGAAPCPKEDTYLAVYGGFAKDNKPSYVILDANTKEVIKVLPSVWAGTWDKEETIFYYADSVPNAETKDGITTVTALHLPSLKEEVIYEDHKNATLPVLHMAGDHKTLMLELWDNFVEFRFVAIDVKTRNATIINQEAKQMNYVDSMEGKHYFVSKEEWERGIILSVDEKGLDGAKVVRDKDEHVIESAFFLKNELYVITMLNASHKLLSVNVDGISSEVKMKDEICTISLLSVNEDVALLSFESFANGFTVLSFDGKTTKELYCATSISAENVKVEQRFAPSKEDKTMIPYFIVYKEGTKLDGNNPVLAYAYGGYNSSMTPWYQDMVSNVIIPDWLNCGGVYVLITLRGGSEFGSSWHEQGMMMQKKNCYYDFIGVCEKIIEDGWTSPKKLAINGCSNGGLLMSTLITMRPDLFGCVINSVPHTDMLHFAEDDNGPRYITEYGNPKESKEMLEYMLSYSPYHNVKEVAYPAMYLQTGECDNNVPPYHGKKFAAKMQEKTCGDKPLLCRVLKEGSHDRGSGDAYWQTISEIRLFLEKNLEM